MIKYILISSVSLLFVFNQLFLFDLFEPSVKVILLLICYIMINNVKRVNKQLFLFFIFIFFEIFTFDTPGYLTLIVLISEYVFGYLSELFKINFINILEFFTYFFLYFLFIGDMFSPSFILNLTLSLVIILFFLFRNYGFTKIFRN